MHQWFYNCLDKYELLCNTQFGLRKCHSIDHHTLVGLKESIKSSLDNNKVGCGIFIDLIKVFDILNYDILLKKLEHYGIRSITLR